MKLAVSLKEQNLFVHRHLSKVIDNAEEFKKLFNVLKWLFGLSTLLSFIVILISISYEPFLSIIQLVFAAIYLGLVIWFSVLASDFAELHIAKANFELKSQLSWREETVRSSDEILSAAKKRAGHKIRNKGDNTVILIGSGTVSNIQQTKTISGEQKLIELLSLVISFAEETGNKSAIEAANKFAEEAASTKPEKGKLAILWGTIAASIPSILSVLKIVNGVKTLF